MAEKFDQRSGTLPSPRDPAIAVQEEYDRARRVGTQEALELFIARHPGSPLLVEAQRALDEVSRRGPAAGKNC